MTTLLYYKKIAIDHCNTKCSIRNKKYVILERSMPLFFYANKNENITIIISGFAICYSEIAFIKNRVKPAELKAE